MMNGMMYSKNICIKWLTKTTSEFEKLREFVINDPTNPNTQDFTRENLIIENHIVYGVAYLDDTPIMMNGLYEVMPGVGRLQNRHYTFPNFRKDIKFSSYVAINRLVKPIAAMSPFNTHILSMKNRREKNNGFFNAYQRLYEKHWPNHWHRIDGYVQTCQNSNSRNCWQKALTDNPKYNFNTINHDQWLLLDWK